MKKFTDYEKVKVIGLDIAKNWFQASGEDGHHNELFNIKIRRDSVIKFFSNFKSGCMIGIEACSGSNYWGRIFTEMGFNVKLIPPQHVKPFVARSKTDAKDAQAICEVVQRPNISFVSIKTEDQQYLTMLHKTRESLISYRIAQENQIRGFLMDYGICINQGVNNFISEMGSIVKEENCTINNENIKSLISLLYQNFLDISKKVNEITKTIHDYIKNDDKCKRLMKMPGVGPIIASALVAYTPVPENYRNGRFYAASLGLTPSEHSSGGKQKLGAVSKRGNSYLRKMLIQGARVIVRVWMRAQAADNDYKVLWLQQLCARRGKFVSAVAYANKMARIAWHLMRFGDEYDGFRQPPTRFEVDGQPETART